MPETPQLPSNQERRTVLECFFDSARSSSARYRATVQKSGGDSDGCWSFAFFEDPTRALDAALDIQQDLTRFVGNELSSLTLISAIHHGEVILEDGGIYGDTVSHAAWALGLMRKAGRIGVFMTTPTKPTMTPLIIQKLKSTGILFTRLKGETEWGPSTHMIHEFVPDSE